MGSRGALLALTVVAAALAVAVSLDRTAPRTSGPRSTRLFPGLAVSEVTALRWRRPGQPTVSVVRSEDRGFALVTDADGPASAAAVDPRVVDDALAALPLLAYRRRVPERAPLEAHWELIIERDGASPLTLRVGESAPGLEQHWVSVDGTGDGDAGLLVDDTALREVDHQPDGLRARALFPVAADAVTAIELATPRRLLVLSGRPLSVHLTDGGRARIDPVRARAALSALGEARIMEFASRELADDALRVRVLGGAQPYAVRIDGPCPAEGGRWVEAAIGTGCASVEALVELADAEPLALVDRLLWPVDADAVVAIERGDERLTATSGLWPGDQAAVRDWLEAVTSIAGELVPAPLPLAGRGVALTARDGSIWRVAVDPERMIVQREGEPVALRLDRASLALLLGEPAQFRDRQIFAIEPVAVRRVVATWLSGPRRGDREELVRGPLIDDWPAARRVAMQRFRAAFGSLTARAWRPGARYTPALALVVDLDPGAVPAAHARRTERVELSAPSSSGCFGRAGGDVFELSAPECDALWAPFR